MDHILGMPDRAYDYIYTQYGTIGLIAAGLMLVVAIVSVFIWMDRRK